METIDLLEQGYAFTHVQIVGIGQTPPDSPTLCGNWNLRQLVNHAVNGTAVIAGVLSGESEVDPWGTTSPDELANTDAGWPHPVARFDEVTSKIVVACREGALERLYLARQMQLPGEFLAHASAFDSIVHRWDIGRSTGQNSTIPTAIAEELLPFAAGIPDEARKSGFGPAVDLDGGASASDRLVALHGRQP